MNKLLTGFVTVFLLSGMAMAANDAPQGDASWEWKICTRTLTQPPELRYDRIVESVGNAVRKDEKDAKVMAKLRQTAESTLAKGDQNDPDLKEFLRRFRAWADTGQLHGATWRIKPGATPENFELFGRDDDPHPIQWSCTADRWSANLVTIAYVSHLLEKAQSVNDEEKLALLDTALRQRYEEYDNLLSNGFSMWPWETYLNGLRLAPSDASHPYTTQLVVMRPSAALEVKMRNQADGNLEASLLLEPIGFVRYTSREYNHWWGASAAVTSSTREGIGYGVLVRYDNYTLGVMHHKSSTAGEPDSNFLLFSMDLYNLLDTKRANIQDFRDKLKDNANCFYRGEACAQQ